MSIIAGPSNNCFTVPQSFSFRQQSWLVANDFFNFIKKPSRRHPNNADVKATATAIFTLLAIVVVFSLLFTLPLTLVLIRVIGLDPRHDLNTGLYMVAALLLAPPVEELIFRAGLRRAFWTLFAMPSMIAMLDSGWLCASFIAGLTLAVALIDQVYRQSLTENARAILRWKRGRAFLTSYPTIIRVYACAFALSHLSNFSVGGQFRWESALVILAVSSQLMGGLILSYIRLRYGLLSSMTTHFLWNSITAGVILFQ